MAGGVLAIALCAVLLAGVVTLNVAVLRLNLRLAGLDEQRAKLRAENARLSSLLSSAAAAPRIDFRARAELGLVPADPAETRYVRLRPRSSP